MKQKFILNAARQVLLENEQCKVEREMKCLYGNDFAMENEWKTKKLFQILLSSCTNIFSACETFSPHELSIFGADGDKKRFIALLALWGWNFHKMAVIGRV